jgi:hypothetical protein
MGEEIKELKSKGVCVRERERERMKMELGGLSF